MSHSKRGTALFAFMVGMMSLAGASAGASMVTAQVMTSYPSTLSDGMVGNAYTMPAYTNEMSYDPTMRYQWQVSNGYLPAGLSLNPTTGQLIGTPTAAGTSTFSLVMMDLMGHSSSTDYTLVIQPSDFMRVANGGIPNATLNQPYNYSFGTQAGTMSGEWMILSGGLPTGLTFSSNGTIQGTPTMAGTWMFNIQAANGGINLGQRTLKMTVIDPSAPQVVDANGTSAVDPHTYPYTHGQNGLYPTAPDMNQPALLQHLSEMGISTNSLVRVSYDPSGMNTNAVYFIGPDGKRHPFMPDQALNSWYADMGTVRTIDFSQLAMIPLGAPIGYRPGTTLIKFQTSPDLYAPQADGTLRRIESESAASSVYGLNWMNNVQTVSDGYYGSYRFQPGNNIMNNSDYDTNLLQARYQTPGDLMTSSQAIANR